MLDAASIKANQLVYDELVKLYTSKRGIKDYTGFYENNMTKMVSYYPELAFHDNPDDARFTLDNKQQIAEALEKGVCGYFGVAYVPASSTGSTTVPQTSEIDRLREEKGKLHQDVIDLNAKLSALENKLKQINQLSAYQSRFWTKVFKKSVAFPLFSVILLIRL